MARSLLLLVLLLASVLAAAVSASSSEESSSKPSILIPVADTPLGSYEGADGPIADDALEDMEAAPLGSPIGTTMTKPEPELPANAPPSSAGATASSTPTTLLAAAVMAAVAGVFAF
ncbi:uncharacterized protein LOC127778800 [Oryza glaberrima]|uniref:Uncharacterized protein n=2 Tax=Oryza TaxID=4527 RepID=A0A0D3GPL1_9ORYZ|nr:uncharacterized protein LOC127778800 [Oryza glaberrima]